jgi:transporter family-2 protein
MIYVRYALWAAAAGAFIPVMAVLNARLGKALGAPAQAPVILFAIALAVALAASAALTGALPSPAGLRASAPVTYLGGVIVAFYVISVTILAPRFGIGNTILFAMIAQILTAATIDHFGLFGAAIRPVTALRAGGLALLLLGLVITQLADRRA